MIAAAALAAANAAGSSRGPNSAITDSITAGLREAIADATNVPARLVSSSTVSPARVPRLSFRSFAYSGSRSRSVWIDIVGFLGCSGSEREGAHAPSAALGSGRLQELVALVPVAGAELVRLEGVQRAQHLLDIAADAQVVHRREPDDAVGVDDERRAQRHAFLPVENAERRRELALDIGEHREREVLQVRMLAAPREVDELAVGRGAVDHRVAVVELAVQLAERRDLGRAHEGEVLRPEEDQLPLAGVGPVGDAGEGLVLLQRHHGLEVELGNAVANGQHVRSS